MLYPYPYLSIHSTLCDTHDSSQMRPLTTLLQVMRVCKCIMKIYAVFVRPHLKRAFGQILFITRTSRSSGISTSIWGNNNTQFCMFCPDLKLFQYVLDILESEKRYSLMQLMVGVRLSENAVLMYGKEYCFV